MESLIADNCHFSMQGKVETKSCRSKGKDKGGIIVVPQKGTRCKRDQADRRRTTQERKKGYQFGGKGKEK